MVYGGSASGLEYWKHEVTGAKLRDYQAQQSKKVVDAGLAEQVDE